MTITQQQIIALAVEAGFNWPEVQTTTIEQRLERFYALAVAKETEARIKLQKEFMEYQNDMQARGTRLIKEAYQRGVRDGREACAITAWNHYMDECRKKNVHPADFGDWCAASAIRARSDK